MWKVLSKIFNPDVGINESDKHERGGEREVKRQVINSPGSEFEFRCGWKSQLILTNRRLALLRDKSIIIASANCHHDYNHIHHRYYNLRGIIALL